jgi:hypothetical protein
MLGFTRWVDDVEELESLFPQKRSTWRQISEWLKDLI